MTATLASLTKEKQAKLRAYSRAYRERNKERDKPREAARHKHKYQNDLEYRKRKNEIAATSTFLKKYKIYPESRDEIFKKQGSCCGICGIKEPQYYWQTDHCHTTGKVRGVLCTACNLLIGRIEAHPDRLQQIVNYIKKHK